VTRSILSMDKAFGDGEALTRIQAWTDAPVPKFIRSEAGCYSSHPLSRSRARRPPVTPRHSALASGAPVTRSTVYAFAIAHGIDCILPAKL